ncbi:MAG: PatB family C-S lyase [Bacteroidales bacterium]|nr:PatB family C-S lyase [Bacteroidales bacterium]
MIYNFDKVIDRTNTECIKYDQRETIFGRADVIPMWVADMDFPTADFIREAVIERAKGDVYGYTFREDAYYESIVQWIERHHQWRTKKEWMSFTPGVVNAFNMAVMGLTKEGDEIIIQPPVYHPFFYAVNNHNRKLVQNTLIDTEDGYVMDYDLLEKQAKTAKMLILCNPHNPVGRSWRKEELLRLGEICMRNDVLVFSDEIHCDLVMPGFKHTPFASLSEEFAQNSITAHAASKTFNLAGMTTSTVIIPNENLRNKFVDFVHSTESDLGNIFGKIATKAAMEKGDEWHSQLINYIKGNIDFATDFIRKEMPKVRIHETEATYMIWLNFKDYGFGDEELNRKLVFEAGVGLNSGSLFGKEGECCMRMNLACPRSVVKTALMQMREVFGGE